MAPLTLRVRAIAAATTLLVAAIWPVSGGGLPGRGPLMERVAEAAQGARVEAAALRADTTGALELNVVAATDRVRPGEEFNYSLWYTNTSDVSVPGVVLTATLSAGQGYDNLWRADPPLPSRSYSHRVGSTVHRWNLGTLAPGAAGRIDLFVLVAEQPIPSVGSPILGVGCSGELTSSGEEVAAQEDLAQAMVLGPVLRLRKKAQRHVYPGRPIVYTLTLTSYGQKAARPDGIPATGLHITDTTPDGTTFLNASSDGTWTPWYRRVLWLLPDALVPDDEVAVTMTLRADPEAKAGTTYENGPTQYRAYADELAAHEIQGDTLVRTTVLHGVEVSVDTGRVVAGRNHAYPGETVTYTVLVHNPEPTRVRDATVVFALPENTAPGTETESPYFSFGDPLGDTPMPHVDGRRLTWTNVALPPWGETELKFTALIDRQAYTLDRVGGWAYRIGGVSVTRPGFEFASVLDRAVVSVVPAVTLNKEVTPGAVLIRRPVTYTLTARNHSRYRVTNLTVTDTIRPQQPTAAMSFTYQAAVDGSPEPVAAGRAPWVWEGLAQDPFSTITITYRAIADGQPNMWYWSDMAAASPDTRTPPAGNRARVNIDSPLDVRATVTPTDSFLDVPVHYDVTVENVDNRVYHLNEVQVDLPARVKLAGGGTTYTAPITPVVPLVPGATWRGGFDGVAGEGLTCRNLALSSTMAPGTIRAHVDEYRSGSFTNREAQARLRLLPNVATTMTATRATALPGDAVTYTLRFDNRSPVDATGLALTLRLPPGFRYISMARGTAPLVGGDAGTTGQELTWFAVKIPAGDRLWLELRARTPFTPGVYTAILTEAGQGRTCVEGRMGARVEVLPPGETFVHLTKTVSKNTVPPGRSVDYTVRVVNDDRDPVVLETVIDTMPAQFGFVEMLPRAGSPPAPEVDGQDLEWRDIVVNGKSTRTWSYRLQTPTIFGGSYANRIRAQARDDTPVEDASATVRIVPQFWLAKVAGAREVVPGQLVPYTITVSNHTEQRATGVRVTDTLPAGLTYVRMLSPLSPITVGQGNTQIAWQLDMGHGASREIVFQARVAPDAFNGVLYNRVDGYAPNVAVPNVDRTAPITVTNGAEPPTPTPTGQWATPTSSPTPTPTVEPSPTPTASVEPSSTPTPGEEPSATPAPTATDVPAATPSATQAPGATATGTVAPEPTPTDDGPRETPTPTGTTTSAEPTQSPAGRQPGRVWLPLVQTR